MALPVLREADEAYVLVLRESREEGRRVVLIQDQERTVGDIMVKWLGEFPSWLHARLHVDKQQDERLIPDEGYGWRWSEARL